MTKEKYMLETKSLLCTNGTHSGSVTCGIDNKELKELYISFFKYMSNKGWKEYLDNTYLTKIINKFSKKCYKLAKEIQDTEEDSHKIVSKFKGNIFEVITESILRNVQTLPFAMKFLSWEGDSKQDRGVDGYCHALNNKNFLISVQSKFRTEETLGWQDGIQKAYVEVNEKMKELRKRGIISNDDKALWEDSIKPVVLFTTTDAHWFLKEAGEKWLNVVNTQDLFEMIGMFDGVGNKVFWDKTYEDVK